MEYSKNACLHRKSECKGQSTLPVRASAPPESPVPAPRPATGRWRFAASFTMRET